MAVVTAWTNLPEARALLTDIVREQPDYFIRGGAWIEGGGVRRYHGRTAGKLRALHSRLLDQALSRADATGDNSEFHELASNMPDEAIAAALAEVQQIEAGTAEIRTRTEAMKRLVRRAA